MALAAFGADAAVCGETVRRQSCPKAEQQQPRQAQGKEQSQQQRRQPQGCPVTRTIPPLVDPTPTFLL